MAKTLRIIGLGFHASQATVTIKLDGATVYTGNVPTDTVNPYTVDMTDAQLSTAFATPVHTWDVAVDSAGTNSLEIEATQGDFVFLRADSNYMPISYLASPSDMFSSGEFGYINCYYTTTSDGVYRDPNSSVQIDSVALTPSRSAGQLLGQWNWGIESGQVFTSTLNVSAGLETPDPLDEATLIKSTLSYTGDGTTNSFAIPTDAGGAVRTTTTGLINGADQLTNWVVDQASSPKVGAFNVVPASGAAIVINRVERFDDSLTSYANFELV